MDEKHCYELLGITKQSTDEEIKKAYRLAAKKCHPDLHLGDKDAEKQFIEISEAYRKIQEIRKKKGERFSISGIGNMGYARAYIPCNQLSVCVGYQYTAWLFRRNRRRKQSGNTYKRLQLY